MWHKYSRHAGCRMGGNATATSLATGGCRVKAAVLLGQAVVAGAGTQYVAVASAVRLRIDAKL